MLPLHPVPAAAVASTVMQFTPVTALVGGLTLGIAATAKFAITGRILGISGALKGCVQADLTPWRLLFTGGMLLGAYAAKLAAPQAFDSLPASFTVRPSLWDMACCAACTATRSARLSEPHRGSAARQAAQAAQ